MAPLSGNHPKLLCLPLTGQMSSQTVLLCYNALSVEPRCFECGNAHIDESCTVREDEVPCLHCLCRHIATSKLCPEVDRQKRNKISMAEESIFYSKASKQYLSTGKSYTNAASSSLSDPSDQELQLPNSLSSNRKTITFSQLLGLTNDTIKLLIRRLYAVDFLLVPMAALFQPQALLRITLNKP
ncbi:hypothetical protein EVAR_8619_1 [Eumeta japonica]|uniref:Nucleic-acid-binding protein from transposon X-element n=1 Tax=Eumeta variegata TaxID=151549 RepID=A0A4C1XGQ9_EUMVA|nr:hypothetical protein EVAR_8619_1 [Eumeta japonica]